MYGTWNSEMQWTFSNVKYPDLPFKHRMRTHILQAMVLLNRCSLKLLLESELFRAFIELSDQRPPPADHCTPTADHDNKRGKWIGRVIAIRSENRRNIIKVGLKENGNFHFFSCVSRSNSEGDGWCWVDCVHYYKSYITPVAGWYPVERWWWTQVTMKWAAGGLPYTI